MTIGPARARYERRKRLRQRRIANAGLWNVLSAVFFICTLLLGGWFAWYIFFRGPSNISTTNGRTLPTLKQIQSEAASQKENSNSNNEFVVSSKTPRPNTENKINPPTLASSTIPDYTFDIQAEPQNISASLFRSDRNCSWMGVAGQTFDLQGRPVPGITVQVTGPLYGKEIQFMSLTGAASWYGEAGYEVFLGDTLFDSSDKFRVMLLDQTGKSLSPPITFSTSSDCSKNLVIINFHQIK